MKLRKRLLSYDVIRITALLMIVMVHVSAYIVIFFPATDKPEWLVGNLFNGLARAGVPLFVLLSGALLLNEDKPFDTKRFFRRKLAGMVLLTVGWLTAYGLFYAVLLPVLEGKPVQMSDFWGYILRFQGSEYPHLWYMLMVVGMYLMIPVLRLFVKRANRKYILGMILASLVVQFGARTADLLCLGCETTVSGFLGKLHAEPLTGFLGLLLTGWYLSEYMPGRGARYALYALGLSCLAVSTFAVYRYIDVVPQIRDHLYSELSLPAFVYGTALFVYIRSVCGKKTTGSRLTAALADGSFGVYLLHVAVLELFVRLVLPYERFGQGMVLPYIALVYLVTLAVSFAAVKGAGAVRGLRCAFYNR